MFSYSITEIQPLADNISRLFLHTESMPLSYEAGQYIEVIHHDQTISPLSIACAPRNDALLEFHLFHPAKNERAQDLLRMATKEKTWHIQGPFGTCTASRVRSNKPLLFVARDTGFAPIKAVIEALIQSQQRSSLMHLYWNMPHSQDFYLTDLLKEWEKTIKGFRFTPVITNEFSQDKEQANTTLLQNIILSDHPDLSHYQVYASGPRSLVYSAFYAFQQRGLHQEFFYSDVFVE